jgi:O-antigen ligase
VIEFVVTAYACITLFLLLVRFERGLLFLLPLFPLVRFTWHSPITGLNTMNLLIYTAFAMGLLRRMSLPERPLPPATVPLISFFTFTLLAWVIGIINYQSEGFPAIRYLINVERWVVFTLLYFAYYFGWSGRFPARSAFRWMLAGIFIAAVANVFEVLHGTEYFARTGRAGGVFGEANNNGNFMAGYAFLPLALAASARKPLQRNFYRVLFGLCFAGVMLSASRSALLSFSGGALVYAYFRSRRALAFLIMALCLVIPFYTFVLPETVVKRIERTTSGSAYEGFAGQLEGSAANRFVQNVAALRLFIDSPILGHGLGGFWYRSPKYLPPGADVRTRAMHSTFLNILVNVGLPGLACLLWVLGGLFLAGKRLYDSGAEAPERLLGLYLMTIMVNKILANVFTPEFLTGDVSAYVWVTAGLVSWLNLRVPAPAHARGRAEVRSTWRSPVRPPVPHG